MGGQFGPNRTSANDSASTTHAVVSVDASSEIIAASNDNRIALYLQNLHATQTIHLSFGGTATVGEGMRLAAGERLRIPDYTGAVYGIGSGSATLCGVIEI